MKPIDLGPILDAAAADTTILLEAGTYTISGYEINTGKGPKLKAGCTLRGAGACLTIVQLLRPPGPIDDRVVIYGKGDTITVTGMTVDGMVTDGSEAHNPGKTQCVNLEGEDCEISDCNIKRSCGNYSADKECFPAKIFGEGRIQNCFLTELQGTYTSGIGAHRRSFISHNTVVFPAMSEPGKARAWMGINCEGLTDGQVFKNVVIGADSGFYLDTGLQSGNKVADNTFSHARYGIRIQASHKANADAQKATGCIDSVFRNNHVYFRPDVPDVAMVLLENYRTDDPNAPVTQNKIQRLTFEGNSGGYLAGEEPLGSQIRDEFRICTTAAPITPDCGICDIEFKDSKLDPRWTWRRKNVKGAATGVSCTVTKEIQQPIES